MAIFCTNCGAAIKPNARFCTSCGTKVDGVKEIAPDLLSSPTEIEGPPSGVPPAIEPIADDRPSLSNPEPSVDLIPLGPIEATETLAPPSQATSTSTFGVTDGRLWSIATLAMLFLLFAVGAAYLYGDHVRKQGGASFLSKKELYGDAIPLGRQTLNVRATSNMRDQPSTSNTRIFGTKPRGTIVSGEIVLGVDGVSHWLRLDENSLYISASILSTKAAPALAQLIESQSYLEQDANMSVKPKDGQPIARTMLAGEEIWIVGVTQNGYTEVVMKGDGIKVGYYKNDAGAAGAAERAVAAATDAAAAAVSASPSQTNSDDRADMDSDIVNDIVNEDGPLSWQCTMDYQLVESRLSTQYDASLDQNVQTWTRTGRYGPSCKGNFGYCVGGTCSGATAFVGSPVTKEDGGWRITFSSTAKELLLTSNVPLGDGTLFVPGEIQGTTNGQP